MLPSSFVPFGVLVPFPCLLSTDAGVPGLEDGTVCDEELAEPGKCTGIGN